MVGCSLVVLCIALAFVIAWAAVMSGWWDTSYQIGVRELASKGQLYRPGELKVLADATRMYELYPGELAAVIARFPDLVTLARAADCALTTGGVNHSRMALGILVEATIRNGRTCEFVDGEWRAK